MKDSFGIMRYEKVHEYLLRRIQGKGYRDWLAVQMRNQMVHIVRNSNYKPCFYYPISDKVILGNHVARFFCCQMA